MAAGKDFYRVLGVSEKASADEIKKVYRRLAKENHPDRNPGDTAAAERFKEVGEAYGVLSDPEKRRTYDQMRRFGGFGGGRAPGRPPSGGAERGGGFSFEDLSNFGGLGDIFSSIFDRGERAGSSGSRGGRGTRARGADVEYVVEIPFVKAALGGKVTINVPITEECATCGGSGAAPGTELRVCGECGGSGIVSFGQEGFAVNRPCPACFGRGRVPESPCASCSARGEVRQERRIAVTVPRGTEDGERLRLTGQGERSTSGGAAGDLLLTFRVKPDPFFKLQGADIHVRVPINIVQATLGSKLKVRTVHGKRVVLTIPPGTQSGTRFRVRGQGIEKGGRRGDQIVEVDVHVPAELSEEERAAMERFAEAAQLRH